MNPDGTYRNVEHPSPEPADDDRRPLPETAPIPGWNVWMPMRRNLGNPLDYVNTLARDLANARPTA